jgi:hypothetical protein
VVARSVSIGRSRRAAVVGMTWPVPAELDRKALERKRFAPAGYNPPRANGYGRCKRHGAAGSPRQCGNPCSGMRSCSAKRANSSGAVRALTIAITRGPSSGTLPAQLPQVVELLRRRPEPGGWFFDRPQAGPSAI